jgi:hypothetical protein
MFCIRGVFTVMKKQTWLLVGVAVLIIAIGAGYFVSKKHTKPTVSAQRNSSQTVAGPQVKACDIYTFNKAQEILGNGTKLSESSPDVKSGNTLVSTCTYTDGSTSPKTLQVSTVLVRSSTDNSSIQGFTSAKPADAVAISGFGDQAYWNPTLGQLNILKGKNWVIISSGSGAVSGRTLEQPKQIAALIVGDL